MTVQDGPRGFNVVGRLGGGEPTIREYDIATVSTAIFIGDLAKAVTDGEGTVMAAASDDYMGVIVGLKNTSGKNVATIAASTGGKMLVCIDKDAILDVQTEDGGTALTKAAIFDAADAIWTHAGAGSRAGVELSQTLAGDGNSAQFRIIDKVNTPGNDWGDHNVRVLVVALEHFMNTTPAAI